MEAHDFGERSVERASCAGMDRLCMREVQSRQVSLPSHAFTVYTMGGFLLEQVLISQMQTVLEEEEPDVPTPMKPY